MSCIPLVGSTNILTVAVRQKTQLFISVPFAFGIRDVAKTEDRHVEIQALLIELGGLFRAD